MALTRSHGAGEGCVPPGDKPFYGVSEGPDDDGAFTFRNAILFSFSNTVRCFLRISIGADQIL